MSRHRLIQPTLVLLSILTAIALGSQAHAKGRRFEPSPRSETQVVQVLNEAAIISAAGRHFSAGASMAPASVRQAWLSVSVKNTGAAPVELVDGAIQVTSASESLRLQDVRELARGTQDAAVFRDVCAYATPSSQINCNGDSFSRRQRQRIEADRSDSNSVNAARLLAPGELAVQQFQLDLPKRNRASPTVLTVIVTVGAEQLAFDFKEVD